MKSSELYGLVAKEDDVFYDVFWGHFEIDGFEDVLTEDSSMRFCMQIHKNSTDNFPDDREHAVGTADSKRSRLRFFNKKYKDFKFFP